MAMFNLNLCSQLTLIKFHDGFEEPLILKFLPLFVDKKHHRLLQCGKN